MRRLSTMLTNEYNNNILSVKPEVGSGESKMTHTFPLRLWGREVVSDRPLAQKRSYSEKGCQKKMTAKYQDTK